MTKFVSSQKSGTFCDDEAALPPPPDDICRQSVGQHEPGEIHKFCERVGNVHKKGVFFVGIGVEFIRKYNFAADFIFFVSKV